MASGPILEGMEHAVLGIYVLCFSTGFMGLAALAFLRQRTRSSSLSVIIWAQALLLLGLMGVGADFYSRAFGLFGEGSDLPGQLEAAAGAVSAASMLGLYAILFLSYSRLGRKGKLEARRRLGRLSALAVLLLLAIEAATRFLPSLAATGFGAFVASSGWSLGGYCVIGAALACLAWFLHGVGQGETRPALRLLFEAYAISTLVFALLGPAEWLLNNRGLALPRPLSLDFLAYLAWNLAAVAAFAVSLRGGPERGELLPSIPEAKAEALGLTAREADMALLIAKGLSNKEIAADLGLSESTVRTHIYNLYRKAGARSRVELLAILRS